MALIVGAFVAALVALALRRWLLKTDKSRLAGWWQDKGPDGLPVWYGKDSIINFRKNTGHFVMACGFLLVIFAAILLGAYLITAFSPYKGDDLSLGYALTAACFVALAAFVIRLGNSWRGQFSGEKWALSASPAGLSFKSAENWAVARDAIARVETARTAEYTPARQVGNKWRDTPAHEWQVFLFLNDGTRRVVYHANAARDDCAALAASIREYVESAKAAAPAPSPSSSGTAGGDAPRAAGFDL